MPKLTQYQRDALLVLRTRLDPNCPENHATDEVKAHLRALGPWLSSWVLPAVECVDSSADYSQRWLREDVAAQARSIRIERARRQRGEE